MGNLSLNLQSFYKITSRAANPLGPSVRILSMMQNKITQEIQCKIWFTDESDPIVTNMTGGTWHISGLSFNPLFGFGGEIWVDQTVKKL